MTRTCDPSADKSMQTSNERNVRIQFEVCVIFGSVLVPTLAGVGVCV